MNTENDSAGMSAGAANDNTGAASEQTQSVVDDSGSVQGAAAGVGVNSEAEQNTGIASGKLAAEKGVAETSGEQKAEGKDQAQSGKEELEGGIASGKFSKDEAGEEKEEEAAAGTADPASLDGFESELEIPKGFEFDAELVDEFKGMAKEAKMSREDAKKFGQYGVKLSEKIMKNVWDAHHMQKQRWEKETLSLPEFKGTQGASNIGVVQNTFANMFSEESRILLAKTGLDSNQHFCKDLLALGLAKREDMVVRGDSSGPAKSEARSYMEAAGFTPVK